MDKGANEWYYTVGSDQVGPVTFEELKRKAAAAEIHPRQDMVWQQGMDKWLPAGEIDNLFEKRVTEVAPEVSATSVAAALLEKEQHPEEVALWPGATRRWYILLMFLFPLLWMVVCLTFATFVGPKLSLGFQRMFMLIGLIVPAWVVIDTSLSRLTNLGMTKLWFFMNFVPVVNLWVWYRSFACPAGYAKTKKLDPIGWVLAIFYWLSTASSVAMAILIPTVLMGQLKESGMIEKCKKLWEQVEATTAEPKKAPEKTKKPVKPPNPAKTPP